MADLGSSQSRRCPAQRTLALIRHAQPPGWVASLVVAGFVGMCYYYSSGCGVAGGGGGGRFPSFFGVPLSAAFSALRLARRGDLLKARCRRLSPMLETHPDARCTRPTDNGSLLAACTSSVRSGRGSSAAGSCPACIRQGIRCLKAIVLPALPVSGGVTTLTAPRFSGVRKIAFPCSYVRHCVHNVYTGKNSSAPPMAAVRAELP